MSSPPSSELVSIPVVVLGWKRTNGIVYFADILAESNAPYVMTAMVDFVETMEPYRYTPNNLGVVLHNLHPRPRALVVGTAVPPSLTDEITTVWNEYVDTVLKEEFPGEEWKKNVCSHVRTVPLCAMTEPDTIGTAMALNYRWRDLTGGNSYNFFTTSDLGLREQGMGIKTD
ncbi:hypothetical protein CTA1_7052 [Colletotrichum tanaceti]|uniref:Uncharacterized protein n=1 Tax=Colletotrichum tanaceti TaxID=1306861 RepID=A0A4U6X7A4_9PEZI|nr:hypothetical protein CTA1_7052 [Colletotrichum tanaceti]